MVSGPSVEPWEEDKARSHTHLKDEIENKASQGS